MAITYFGDGATSEGDFHEAMNFAAVFETPCVFFCQNNGWAISLPRESQTRSETIAQKAIAYGMPGFQVDGNDLFAVYQMTLEAVDRARVGEGPDPDRSGHLPDRPPHHGRRSRPLSQPGGGPKTGRRRDPLERVRLYLSERELGPTDWQHEIEREAAAEIDRAVELAEEMPPLSAGDIFDAMFEEPTAHLRRQQSRSTRQDRE